jgi:hypothetical protein
LLVEVDRERPSCTRLSAATATGDAYVRSRRLQFGDLNPVSHLRRQNAGGIVRPIDAAADALHCVRRTVVWYSSRHALLIRILLSSPANSTEL